MPFDPSDQRRILGRFATGVTVVTTLDGTHGTGMTASAVASLSLNPPLVLVAVDRKGQTHAHLQAAGCFALNILAEDQEAYSRRFAGAGPKDLSDLATTTAVTGAPLLPGTLGWVDCRIASVFPGGDHDVFVGEIVAGDAREGRPLLYYAGRYRQLPPDA